MGFLSKAADRLVATLEAQLADARARNAQLETDLAAVRSHDAALAAELAVARKRIVALEAKLKVNSRNSSKPPSTDPPDVERPKKKRTGRKPGGQPGHKRHERPRVDPDHTVDEPPSPCDLCGEATQAAQTPSLLHQVVDIPPVKPEVTEHRCYDGYCKPCNTWTPARLPPGVPRRGFGPRLTAMICVLTGKYLGTKRRVRDMLHDLFGVVICIGSISNLEQEVSHALASPVEEAAQHVKAQRVANGDETGWFQGRSEGRAARAWLWTVVTLHVTVFRIAMSRGADVAQEMLGETFAGILGTDRWGAYSWVDARRRQLCWSHLIRDFQGFVDRRGVSAQIGTKLIEQVDLMFRWWHRIRDGTMTRSTFQRRMRPVEKKIYALLEEAEVRAGGKTAGMAKRMLTLREAFFTFVHEAGVEPTNNISERTIRHGVIWRKISFGTQSPDGSRYVERMLTVVATCRQQNRNVLEYVTAAYTAHLNGAPPPSLIPPT